MIFVSRLVKNAHNWTQKRCLSIAFYGSDSFSRSVLKTLCQGWKNKTIAIDDLFVITSKTSLGNPVWHFSQKNNLKLFHWPTRLSEINLPVTIGVVASFGHLIPKSDIDFCQKGIINIHASLLPRWRGAAPIPHAILNGDSETGITIMSIKPHQFDVGEIISQKAMKIPTGITSKELSVLLAQLASEMLVDCLSDLDGSLANATPQPTDGVTNASKIKKEDGHIKFFELRAEEIYRKYRAFVDYVDLYANFQDRKLKFIDIFDPPFMEKLAIDTLIVNKESIVPGMIFIHSKRNILCIKCRDSWIGFSKVIPFGVNRRLTPLKFKKYHMLKGESNVVT